MDEWHAQLRKTTIFTSDPTEAKYYVTINHEFETHCLKLIVSNSTKYNLRSILVKLNAHGDNNNNV